MYSYSFIFILSFLNTENTKIVSIRFIYVSPVINDYLAILSPLYFSYYDRVNEKNILLERKREQIKFYAGCGDNYSITANYVIPCAEQIEVLEQFCSKWTLLLCKSILKIHRILIFYIFVLWIFLNLHFKIHISFCKEIHRIYKSRSRIVENGAPYTKLYSSNYKISLSMFSKFPILGNIKRSFFWLANIFDVLKTHHYSLVTKQFKIKPNSMLT